MFFTSICAFLTIEDRKYGIIICLINLSLGNQLRQKLKIVLFKLCDISISFLGSERAEGGEGEETITTSLLDKHFDKRTLLFSEKDHHGIVIYQNTNLCKASL